MEVINNQFWIKVAFEKIQRKEILKNLTEN